MVRVRWVGVHYIAEANQNVSISEAVKRYIWDKQLDTPLALIDREARWGLLRAPRSSVYARSHDIRLSDHRRPMLFFPNHV